MGVKVDRRCPAAAEAASLEPKCCVADVCIPFVTSNPQRKIEKPVVIRPSADFFTTVFTRFKKNWWIGRLAIMFPENIHEILLFSRKVDGVSGPVVRAVGGRWRGLGPGAGGDESLVGFWIDKNVIEH